MLKILVEFKEPFVAPESLINNCCVWILDIGANEYNAEEPLRLTGFIVSCVPVCKNSV